MTPSPHRPKYHVINKSEGAFSDHMAVVIYPTTYFLIKLTSHPNRRYANALLDYLANIIQKRLDTAFAGHDQQFMSVFTDVETQKVKSLVN